jgi:hypothetical protein
MIHPRIVTLAFGVASVGAALAACAPHKGNTTTTTTDTESQSLADDGSDTVGAEADAESLTGTLLSNTGSTVGLATEPVGSDLSAANMPGAGAKLFFLPLGCLTTENPTATSVKYTFNGCTGRLGLTKITGVITAEYTTAPSMLTLNLTGTGLKVNRATIDWTATAVITATGANRSMQWDGHFTGTSGGGRAIERTNTKVVTWTVGDSCFEINGTSKGNVTGKDLKIDLTNFKRCKASCPEVGSEIKITRESTGKFVDIVYDAGYATFTDSRGDNVQFTPLCASL